MSRFTTLIVLLTGAALVLMGNGLFGTLLGVRANIEAFGVANTGAIMSAYFVGYALGSYILVGTVVRVGHIRVLAALSAILSAIAITHAIAVDLIVWGILRFVSGLCIVGVFLVIESWLNSSAPSHLRGRVFSVYMTVNLLAVAAGQFLLAAADPAGFVLFAFVSILFALSLVPTALARVDAPPPVTPGGLTLRELYAASPVGTVGCFACGFVGGSFWGMGPVFASGIGLAQTSIASFMSATILGGMAAQWPVGSISDRIDRRKMIVAVAGVGVGAALLTAILAGKWLPAMLASAALFGSALFPLYSLTVARTHDVLGPDKVLEATRGLIVVFGIGAAMGPTVSGWVMEAFAPYAIFLLFAIIFALFALFSLYRLPRGETVAPDDQSTYVPMMRTSAQAVEMAETVNLQANEPPAQKKTGN